MVRPGGAGFGGLGEFGLGVAWQDLCIGGLTVLYIAQTTERWINGPV